MSSWKKVVGLDFVETAIWAAGAFFTVIYVGETSGNGELASAALVGVLVVFGIRRHFAMRGRPAEVSGEVSGGWRTADLEGRVADLESMAARVAELEERLDFTERLLASQAEAKKLEAPR